MNALALTHPTPANCEDEFGAGAPSLSVFDHVPKGHDVVPLGGLVAIFDSQWREIEEGRYYVVESQAPVSGMGWEAYDQFNEGHAPGEPRVRIKTSRYVIRAVRRPTTGNAWWFVLESGFHDGPIADWAVGHNVVGEVVGIYRLKC